MTKGHNHIRKKVENGESTKLTASEAREQLQYELRDQMGRLTFETKTKDEWADGYGDGTVIAKINGEQVDHYIYHEDGDSE